MALTKGLEVQGTTPTTVDATDSIAFSDGTFDNAVVVDEYNGGTHVRSDVGADDSSANTPKNSQYLTTSTVDIGGGSVNLSTVSTANCPLKITLTESVSITVSDIKMYAYDGTTTTVAPVGMTVQMAEQGDTNWTQAHGSASAVTFANSSTPATSHDFYGLISASPTSVGTKTANKMRFSFTYQ